MKRFLLTFAAMLLVSVGAFAQSNETPLKGDVNEDGVVDVADINAIIAIMKNGGGTGQEKYYYTYIGTDATFKVVDEKGDVKPTAAANLPTMPGVVTSTTKPSSINDAYPVGTVITPIDGIAGDYVYIIALSSLFNKSDNTQYFKTPNGNPVAMDELGTFTIRNNTYKVLSTRGHVSTVIVQ